MERSLLPVVVITDAQARRSGFLDNQPTQRLDFERLALARRVSAPLTGAGNCLKRPTDKLDATLHAGAILIRLTPPRQFHQIGQPVQAGTHGIGIVRHDPPTVRGGEGFRIRQSRSAKILWKDYYLSESKQTETHLIHQCRALDAQMSRSRRTNVALSTHIVAACAWASRSAGKDG